MFEVEPIECYKVGDRIFDNFFEAEEWKNLHNNTEKLLDNLIVMVSAEKDIITFTIKGKLYCVCRGTFEQITEDGGVVYPIIYEGLKDYNIDFSPDKTIEDYKTDVISVLTENKFWCKTISHIFDEHDNQQYRKMTQR